jgi:Tol biopolymer transport system component
VTRALLALTCLLLLPLALAACANSSASRAGTPPAATPAVSALGKIAYVHDGDLYVKQLPDGAARRITTHTYGNTAYSDPQWSQSGEWLLAYTNAQAAIMRADGSGERKLDGRFSQPVWSPTDDRLVYVALGDGGQPNQLVVENADGSGRAIIARAQPASDEIGILADPTWSDDGTWIAYVESHRGPIPFSIPEGANVTLPPTYEAIRVTSFGGRPPEEMYVEDAPPRDGIGLVHWSHGGLFFYRDPGFSIAISDGVELMLLNPFTNSVVEDDPLYPTIHFIPTQPITISPADPMILLDPSLRSTENVALYAVTDGAGRETWTHKRIAGLSWASGTVFDLTGPSVAAIQPDVAPDRRIIAYSAMPDTPALTAADATKQALMQRTIWTVDLSTQKCGDPPTLTNCTWRSTQLTDDPAYRDEYPQWSPDGTQILFVRMDAQDHASLWLMDADGSHQHEVLGGFDIPLIKPNADPGLGYYGTISWQASLAWYRPAGRPASSAAPPVSSSPVDTPVPCATPSAFNRIDTADDALHLAFSSGTDTASLVQIESVERVSSAAVAAVAMFINSPATSPFGRCLSIDSDAWTFVAHGTFVNATPPIDEGRTYHTFWAIAIKGTDEVLSGFDPPSADLSQLGPVTTLPRGSWQEYERPPPAR